MPVDPVVVVGAGFGGLAAAVRLRAMGYPVLVLEASDQAGGRARRFERDGFGFDAGPTVVTAPGLFDELFQLAGRDPGDYYELLPVDPYYRVLFEDGTAFDYVGDETRLLDQIAELSPGDADGYRRLAVHDCVFAKQDDLSRGRCTDCRHGTNRNKRSAGSKSTIRSC